MLEFTALQEDIATLPQVDQMLIVDFVALLKQRYIETQSTTQSLDNQLPNAQPPKTQPLDLENEPFVGMWKDNTETKDSSATKFRY